VVEAYPPVRVVSGPTFEVIAELAAFTSGPARPSLESGKAWIREVRQLAGRELIERVERWGFPLYTELASIALQLGPPFVPARLVAGLQKMPAAKLRLRLLGAESAPNRAMVSDDAFERAIAGDRPARAELRKALGVNPPARAGLERLLDTDPEACRTEIASIVEAWAAAVSPAFAERSLALVERDVTPKEGLLRVTAPRDALRVFTNGVDIDPTGWATSIVVVPVVALRPFIAPVEWAQTLIILASVADETMDAVAGGPPRKLVKVATALGDELRLRILHELGNGQRTATELAQALEVDRTSLHHHLGILRSAGLVAVAAENAEHWRYSLRTDGVDHATKALLGYLTPGR
jgi:DNA-binding transcriptional ArsR family regulator